MTEEGTTYTLKYYEATHELTFCVGDGKCHAAWMIPRADQVSQLRVDVACAIACEWDVMHLT